MKRKMLSVLLAALMALSPLMLVSCQSSAKPPEGSVTRMTVDINPSVEFMIDDENKVMSATALNDDGSILLVGEAFVGKTPEEAVELMVSIAAETGYLVQGQVEVSENTVKISVSGDTQYAKELRNKVEKKASAVMKKLDISGAVEQAEALNTEMLRALAASTSLYTDEELASMDDEKLCAVIAQGRVETALLLTEEMREAYYYAKEYEISFAEREETAKVIESLGGLYTLTYTAYQTALTVYSTAITELDQLRYNLLVSPESEYQKSLTKLREAKTELLKQRNYTASLSVNSETYASATITLQMSEETYNQALAAYEELGNQANAAMEALIAKLRQAEETFKSLEDTMFDENIEAKLTEKAAEIEANLNLAKDRFFDEFEAAHADDIRSVEAALQERKQQLKDAIAAES